MVGGVTTFIVIGHYWERYLSTYCIVVCENIGRFAWYDDTGQRLQCVNLASRWSGRASGADLLL